MEICWNYYYYGFWETWFGKSEKKKYNEFQSQILSVFYRSLFPLSSFHSGSLHYESIDDLLCLEILQITFSKVWIRTDFCTPLGHSFTVRQQQYSEETINERNDRHGRRGAKGETQRNVMGGCFGHATKRVNCSKKHDGLFMTTYCKNAGKKKKRKKRMWSRLEWEMRMTDSSAPIEATKEK